MVGGRQKTRISSNYDIRVEQDQNPNYYLYLLRLSGHCSIKPRVSTSGPVPAEAGSCNGSLVVEHCYRSLPCRKSKVFWNQRNCFCTEVGPSQNLWKPLEAWWLGWYHYLLVSEFSRNSSTFSALSSHLCSLNSVWLPSDKGPKAFAAAADFSYLNLCSSRKLFS